MKKPYRTPTLTRLDACEHLRLDASADTSLAMDALQLGFGLWINACTPYEEPSGAIKKPYCAPTLTQLAPADVAEAIGVSKSTFERWIKGEAAPHPALVPAIAKAIHAVAGARKETHCMRDPSVIGCCAGPGSCSCECNICCCPNCSTNPCVCGRS